MVVSPRPLILTKDVSTIDATPGELLENENTPPLPFLSVFVDAGSSLNDALPYGLVIGARV